jgi:hypothetical protein
MELSDATEKTPATAEIDPGTFRHVPQYLKYKKHKILTFEVMAKLEFCGTI